MSCMKIWMCSALQKNVFKYPAITAHSGRKPRGRICTARCENMNRQNSNLKKSTQKWMSARSERKKPRIIERKSDAKTWMPSHFQLALESGCAHKHSFHGFCSYLSQCAAAASADDACIPLYYNKHFAEERKKKSNDIGDDQQRELHAKSNGAWKTKRNESKGEERKSQKVFGVLKIWRWTRETAMNVLWCMQKIPRIMLCVRVFVSRPFRKEAPRNSIFLWMYKWVLSSWLNQWTKRSFGETLKSLSDQPMHTHSRTLMPRTSSLSTVVRVRCAFFIPF